MLQSALLEHRRAKWWASLTRTLNAFSTPDAPADGFLLSEEYKNKWITKIAGGDVYIGCYLLAITIFLLGMVRDSLWVFARLHDHCGSILFAHVSLSYTVALKEQPNYPLLPAPFDVLIPAILAGFGQILVISSTWALGITGTFLGDYFGILMDQVGLTFWTFGQGGRRADPPSLSTES